MGGEEILREPLSEGLGEEGGKGEWLAVAWRVARATPSGGVGGDIGKH